MKTTFQTGGRVPENGLTMASDQTTHDLLTADDAATRLGLARSTVYQLMDAGQLPYYRFGRARRIDPADLDQFKLACRVGPAPHSGCRVATGTQAAQGVASTDWELTGSRGGAQ